jgi:hypothetical protein
MDCATILLAILAIAIIWYIFTMMVPSRNQLGGDNTGALIQLETSGGPEDQYLMTMY